jgi:hypothetical protein
VDPPVTVTIVVSLVTCPVTARRRGLPVPLDRRIVVALEHATIVAKMGTCQEIARKLGLNVLNVARMIVNVITVEDLGICLEIALKLRATMVGVDAVAEVAIKNVTNVVAQTIFSVIVPRTQATVMVVHAVTTVMKWVTSPETAPLRLSKPRHPTPHSPSPFFVVIFTMEIMAADKKSKKFCIYCHVVRR